MEGLVKLLQKYSDIKGKEMFIVINPDGEGWVEDTNMITGIEFENINDLKYQLENACANKIS